MTLRYVETDRCPICGCGTVIREDMEPDFKFVKPYVVTVEEVRQKQVVVYAEGESDAAWMALKLAEKDVVTVDAAAPVRTCKDVKEKDPLDKKWYPMYGMEGSQ